MASVFGVVAHGGRIFAGQGFAENHGQCNRCSPERSSPFRKSAVFTTVMSGTQPERDGPLCGIYAGTADRAVQLDQTAFSATHCSRGLVHLDATANPRSELTCIWLGQDFR
jgi:hypothetical protein